MISYVSYLFSRNLGQQETGPSLLGVRYLNLLVLEFGMYLQCCSAISEVEGIYVKEVCCAR